MPDLPVQIAIPDSRTADFMVCRALLKRGRPYEEAVKQFTSVLARCRRSTNRRARACGN